MAEIDYTKLNEQIVRQAYKNLPVLSKEDTDKLIAEKFERAKQYQAALEKSPVVY
jgi:hypothetical protein